MNKLIIRSLLTWILFIPVAIINGITRELLYKRYTGDLLAHQISTATASAAFFALFYYMLRNKITDIGRPHLLIVGFFLVILTVGFEFGFGHYIDGASWEHLLADYNMFQGRMWGIFLLVILVTPLLIKQLHDKLNK